MWEERNNWSEKYLSENCRFKSFQILYIQHIKMDVGNNHFFATLAQSSRNNILNKLSLKI